MNTAKFQLYPHDGFLGENFHYCFANLAFRLPWQSTKFKSLDKNDIFGERQLKGHFCIFFLVKISALR